MIALEGLAKGVVFVEGLTPYDEGARGFHVLLGGPPPG